MRRGGVRCFINEWIFESRTMCVSCHLDSVEEPRSNVATAWWSSPRNFSQMSGREGYPARTPEGLNLLILKTEGPRMTDETGDTWQRTRTVDIEIQHVRKLVGKERGRFEISFTLRPDGVPEERSNKQARGEHRWRRQERYLGYQIGFGQMAGWRLPGPQMAETS